MKTTTNMLCLSLVLLLASCRNDRNAGIEAAKDINEMRNISDTDSKFMVEATHDAQVEVELASYARNHAMTQKAKDFAAQIAREHSKVTEELKALADEKGISVPADLDAMPDVKDITDDWDEERIGEFDKVFIRQMVKDHRRVVDKFDRASRNCEDADIRALAARTLPALRSHLEMAQQLKDEMKDRDAALAREYDRERKMEKTNRPGATRQ